MKSADLDGGEGMCIVTALEFPSPSNRHCQNGSHMWNLISLWTHGTYCFHTVPNRYYRADECGSKYNACHIDEDLSGQVSGVSIVRNQKIFSLQMKSAALSPFLGTMFKSKLSSQVLQHR